MPLEHMVSKQRGALLALVFMAMALSGCVGGDDSTDPAATGSSSGSGAGGGDDGTAGGSGSNDGDGSDATNDEGSTGTGGEEINATDPNAPPPPPEVTEFEGTFLFRAHAGTGPMIGAGDENGFTTVNLDQTIGGYLIIMEWTPASALTQEMTIWGRKAQDPDYVAEGPSPVRLIMQKQGSADGEYQVHAIAHNDAADIGANQGFKMTIANFASGPLDPDWQPT